MDIVNPAFNPVPPDPVAGYTTTPDGVRLRFARWETIAPPCKGTVVLLHGRAEYIEKLYETVQDLRRSGFDVLTFDWRGQGGSDRLLADRRKGFIEHFEQYVTDLETISSEVMLPDCRGPYFFLGHSTGALVALLAAPRFANRIRRMVLGSPLLALGSQPIPPSAAKWLTGAMHVLGLGDSYAGGGANLKAARSFAGNRLTSDPVRFKRNADMAAAYPELTIGSPTASWVFAACRAMEQVNDPDFHGSITIPTLIICAGRDRVVDNRPAERLGMALRSGHCLTINGARHEMLQERDTIREQFLAAFNAFIPGSMATAAQVASRVAARPA